MVGGVSSWVHKFIKSFPNSEFILQTIVSNRSNDRKFLYELPENVTEVHELYLQDDDWHKSKRLKSKLNKDEHDALRSLVMNKNVRWNELFKLFQNQRVSLNKLLMGEDFLNVIREYYDTEYDQLPFTDFLWTMRSVYLPLFFTLKMEIPKADLYHSVATGYAGVLGSMGKTIHGGRLLISEHGIYTREREEELLRSDWVKGVFKKTWIDQFRKMSNLAYEKADLVTSLYSHAQELQIEIGCPAQKTIVTPNGIDVDAFKDIPAKLPEDEDKINIGAVLRVTPIKDIKTMIQAFRYAKDKDKRLRLWIMGPWDEDKEYAQECFEQVESLGLSEDVIFTGMINVKDYLGRMDMTILTSISEGQPLTILESYAARKPVIATDVGNCSGLIYGENDDFGDAGILTHIMNVEEIGNAMVTMAKNKETRLKMGENGFKRANAGYRQEMMQDTYYNIYKDFAQSMNLPWNEKRPMADNVIAKG